MGATGYTEYESSDAKMGSVGCTGPAGPTGPIQGVTGPTGARGPKLATSCLNSPPDRRIDATVAQQDVPSAPPLPQLPPSLPAEELGEATADESMQCCICMTSRACTTLLECGHSKLCVRCARTIVLKGDGLCPDCRAPITRVIKIFR